MQFPTSSTPGRGFELQKKKEDQSQGLRSDQYAQLTPEQQYALATLQNQQQQLPAVPSGIVGDPSRGLPVMDFLRGAPLSSLPLLQNQGVSLYGAVPVKIGNTLTNVAYNPLDPTNPANMQYLQQQMAQAKALGLLFNPTSQPQGEAGQNIWGPAADEIINNKPRSQVRDLSDEDLRKAKTGKIVDRGKKKKKQSTPSWMGTSETPSQAQQKQSQETNHGTVLVGPMARSLGAGLEWLGGLMKGAK